MGRPKALLAVPGAAECFLDRLIGAFEPHCSVLVVVLGHDADAIRAGLRRPAVFVTNPDPERGQLSSLQCGLAAVGGDSGVLFTPVDHALVLEETIAKLVAAYRAGSAPVLAPRFQGRHGHPVACAPEVAAELAALRPGAQARDVIRSHRAATEYVDVNDPAVVEDIDDPAAYARACEASRR